MSELVTLREWFKGLDGPIVAARFFPYDSWRTDQKIWPNELSGRLLEPQEIEPFLDVLFNPGFGTQGCPDFYVWTKDSVYYVHEYDGSVSLCKCPRDPK